MWKSDVEIQSEVESKESKGGRKVGKNAWEGWRWRSRKSEAGREKGGGVSRVMRRR